MHTSSSCIYCSIIAGSISCAKVFENDVFLAFLDIFPASSGHTLLIPKKHTRWVYEVEPLEEFWATARSIVYSQQKNLQPTWVQYFTHGALDHAHLHIIPRYDNIHNTDPLLIQPTTPESPENLAIIAQKIRL